MQAVTIDDKQLYWNSCERPSVAANEVLIKVAYAGINRADLMQAAGQYPPPSGVTDVPGLEVSGEILECGAEVTDWQPGQQVCALLAGGGYADYVAVPACQVAPIPAGLDVQQAAAICEVYATAWMNIFMLAAAQSGERVLLHAGASGVGSAAIQLCRQQGNPCFVTVGSDEKLDYCLALGAEAGWNRQQGEFVDAVKQWGNVDVILDPVAGAYLYQDQQVLNQDGRIVVIGLMAGRDSRLDAGRLLMKRQRLMGSTLRSQPSQRKGEVMQQLITHVWPGFSTTEQPLSAQVDKVFERERVRDAHAYLAANRNQGKVLLAINP